MWSWRTLMFVNKHITSQIRPFMYFSRWRLPLSWISKSAIMDPRWPLCCQYQAERQIRCNLVKNWLRYAFYVLSKMKAAAIFSFQKVQFWALCDHCIGHKYLHMAANLQKVLFSPPRESCICRIYQHTKCGANRSTTGWDTPFCVFYKMVAGESHDGDDDGDDDKSRWQRRAWQCL